MAKTRYDLRRIRKIYPVRRRSPLFIDTASDLEAFKIDFDGTSLYGEYNLTESYSTAPVVVVSAELDNVNVFVHEISGSPSAGYTVKVTVSHLFTGRVHGFSLNPSDQGSGGGGGGYIP